MYARPSGPQSIGGVLDDAIRLYRASFRHCWGMAFAVALLIAALQVSITLGIPDYGLPGHTNPLEALAVFESPAILGAYAAVIVVSPIFYGALLAQQIAVARGDASPSVARALAKGVRRLPAMALASIVCLLAVCIGLVALVVPGLYLWGRLQLWMPVLFAEDTTAMAALGASWHLTQSRWWRAATIFTVGVIIALVFSIAVGAVAGVTAVFAHGSHSDRQIIIQLISVVSNTIIYPVTPALWVAMYHDFKLRREGGDLVERVGALSNA